MSFHLHFGKLLTLQWRNRVLKLQSINYSSTQMQIDPKNLPSQQQIIIPKRKKRDSTSILKALSATVKEDLKSTKYGYIDDPHLIPYIRPAKLRYHYSKLSGIEAANYVIEQNANVFQTDPAEPSIKPFNILSMKHDEDTIEGLTERINNRLVTEAWQSYETLEANGTDVPIALQEELLDLLCVHNSKEIVEEDVIHSSKPAAVKPSDRWSSDSPAEKLFARMEEKTPRAYNSIIYGSAKFKHHEHAYAVYKKARIEGIPIDELAFNELIKSVRIDQRDFEKTWQNVLSLLNDMRSDDVSPTVDTFNSVLLAIDRIRHHKKARQYAMSTLNEMKHLNIEPSLTTWARITQIFYRTGGQSDVLIQILAHIKGKEFTYREQPDYVFFLEAMRVASQSMKDLELAYAINDLIEVGNNRSLIGNMINETNIYGNLLSIVFELETMDKIMEIYDKVTPHCVTPKVSEMTQLLNAIELNNGYEHLTRLWNDIVLYNYTIQPVLLDVFLSVLISSKDKKLLNKFIPMLDGYVADIEMMFERFKSRPMDRFSSFKATSGKVIGHLVMIALSVGEEKKAWHYIDIYYLNKNDFNIEAFPSELSLCRLLETAINDKNEVNIHKCLKMMDEASYPKIEKFLHIIRERSALDEELLAPFEESWN